MKNFPITYLIIIGIIMLSTHNVEADWKLYDNFNSATISRALWKIANTSATISIEKGKAKFEHKQGYPGVAGALKLIRAPHSIMAVAATITVESCTGDVEGRVSGLVGSLNGEDVGNKIVIQGGQNQIWGGISILDSQNPKSHRTIHKSKFAHSDQINVLGTPYTIAASYHNPKEVIYIVNEIGKSTFNSYEPIFEPRTPGKQIGTFSVLGDGPCIVLFDDVYVWLQ